MSVRHNEQFNGKFDYIDHHGSCKKCPKKQSKKIKPAQMMLLYSVIYKQITLFWTFFCRLLKYGRSNLTQSTISWRVIKEQNLKTSSLKNSRYESHDKVMYQVSSVGCRLKIILVWVYVWLQKGTSFLHTMFNRTC